MSPGSRFKAVFRSRSHQGSNLVTGRVQSADTSNRAASNLNTANNEITAITASSTLPLAQEFKSPSTRSLQPPASGPISRKDALRTAYNGFNQILNIAAESADAFPPLKSVLGGLRATIKVFETNSNNKKDLSSLLDRLGSLEALQFPETVDAKLAGRDNFLPKLVAIGQELHRISGQNAFEIAMNATQDEKTIAGLVADLANALAEYQTSMQHTSLKMSSEIIGKISSLSRTSEDNAQLDRLPRAQKAGFNSGNRASCLEGTRKEILEKITAWANDINDRRVFWLNGNAGSGKSTIGQTFAERCAAQGLLGASFFCSRDFQDRSNLDLIFPTLALELAYHYPAFKDALVPIIKESPNPGHESLSSQLETLLIAPLNASGVSTVIIIDAIDECKDTKSTSALLSVLGRHIDDLSSTKIFITGRPESRIQSAFNLPVLRSETDVFLLHEVERMSVDNDIRLYFRSQFSELIESRTEIEFPSPWPDGDSLDSLVERADGLFIFASTTCKVLSSENHNPLDLLQLILSTPLRTEYEGQLELDALYTQILTENFKPSRPPLDVSKEVNSILGTVVVAPNPVLLITLAILLNKDLANIRPLLRSLGSMLRVPPSPDIPVSFFHKSFPDFLTDENRCGEPRFYIDVCQHHTRLAMRSLELMQQRLKHNICDLPRYSLNSEIKDLSERRNEYIGESLEYACTSWAQHLSQASKSHDIVERLVELTEDILQHHLLSWLEILSIGGAIQKAVYLLGDAKAWFSQFKAQSAKVLASIEDGERFVLTFFDVIQVSVSHIYESAIYQSPLCSLVRHRYQHLLPRTQSWHVVDDYWDACVRKMDIKLGECVTFSHKGDRIAACGGYDKQNFLVVIDATTGTTLSTFKGHEQIVYTAAFSPDDSLLVSASEDSTVRLWNIRTGALIRQLSLEGGVKHVGFSHDGSMIVCNFGVWDSTLENLLHKFDKAASCLAWSPSKAVCLGYENGGIKVLDATNSAYRDLSGHMDTDSILALAYSRDGGRIVSGSNSEITVRDADTGAVLQSFKTDPEQIRSICFSREGERIIIAHGEFMDIRDLENSVIKVKQPNDTYSVSVSPDGMSIALADVDKLSIWEMNGPMQSSETTTHHSEFITGIAISPDSTFIASISEDHTVRLWDFATGTCLHILEGHSATVYCVAISRDSSLITSGSNDRTVRLWDFATGTCLYTLEGHSEQICCVAISPDSSLVASGSYDKTIKIWRVADSSLVCTLRGHSDWATGVDFSHDGQRLVSISDDGVVRLWEVEEQEIVGVLEATEFGQYAQPSIRFSEDGTGITVFKDEELGYWKIVPCDISSSADPSQFPTVTLVPQDHGSEVPSSSALYKSDLQQEWITHPDGRHLFWLPPDLRSVGSVRHQGSKIVMGMWSGRLFWFDFDL